MAPSLFLTSHKRWFAVYRYYTNDRWKITDSINVPPRTDVYSQPESVTFCAAYDQCEPKETAY